MADGVDDAPILRDHSGRVGQLDALRSSIRAAGIRGMGFLVTRLHGGRGYRSPHGTRRDLVDAPAMTDDADLPTARTTLAARYVRVLLTCWHCRHQADADLPALIEAGRGDVPLARLRWRCARCRSDRVNMICKMSRLLLAILVVGCTPEHPFDHEASVLRLLAQERAQRQEQQGEEVKQLGFNRCYRLLADVPADAFSRGFLTPQEQFCYNAQELN